MSRCTLRREIGRGGMCVVYAAEHRYTGRNVAVKVLAPGVGNRAEMRARLLREASALGKLNHPNVLQVHDAGVEPNGDPFLVLELAEGRTLDGILTARGRLTPPEALHVVRKVALALGAAHQKGIVHRDVKPSNVFIVHGRSGENVKLGDFGLAYVPSDDDHTPRLTGHGIVLGTPEYMAPEQLMSMPFSLQADIWGLGIMLHELLTGDVPFAGNYHDVLLKTMASNKPAVDVDRSDIPQELIALLNRALSRDTKERFANTDDFVAAVDATKLAAPTLALLRGAPPLGNNDVVAKRAQVRVAYMTPARVDTDDKRTLSGRCENISLGGVLFLLEEDLPVGLDVTICFGLPVTGLLSTIRSTVRWVKKGNNGSIYRYAVGFEFHYLEPKAKEEIRRYVELMSANGPGSDRS